MIPGAIAAFPAAAGLGLRGDAAADEASFEAFMEGPIYSNLASVPDDIRAHLLPDVGPVAADREVRDRLGLPATARRPESAGPGFPPPPVSVYEGRSPGASFACAVNLGIK
ncbi:MAG: hypothetical protein ABI810_15750 [Sphingomonas bacterium]